MKIVALFIGLHVAIIAASITSIAWRRQGWSFYAGIGSLPCLSIAPLLLGLFFLTSAPHFNKSLGLAVAGGTLYATSAIASIAALLSVLAARRAASA